MKNLRRKGSKVTSRITSRVLALMLFIQLVFFEGITAFAAGSANITFSTVGTPNVGQTIEILVNAENVQNLYGASVDFTYDQSVLEIQGIEKGNVFNGTNALAPVLTFGNGQGNIAMMLTASDSTISGNGTLAVIKAKVLNDGIFNLKATAENEPLTLDNKTFRVKLSSQDGKSLSYTSIDAKINTTAQDLYFENLATNLKAPQEPGTAIRILPKVVGGAGGYRYKFYVDEGNGFEVKQDFGSKSYYDWTPTKVGNHKICVEILDADRNFTAAQISYEVKENVVEPLYFEDLSTDKAAPQLTGSTIKVLPKVIGGVAPYRYKFFIDEGNGLEVKQDFSSKNYYDFKPSKAGKHTICVEILDAKGNFTAAQIPYEVVNSFAKPLYFENLSTDKAAPQLTGSTIKILPKVTGGVEPYRYKFFIDEGNGLEVKQDFSSKNYYDFKPSKAGKHTICVEILDAKGNFTAAQIPYEVVNSFAKPLYFENLGTDKAAPQLTGSTIKILPKVTGGVEPYRYKFFIDEGNGLEVKQDFSSKNYYDFKPSKAGKHTICVEILDAKGNFTAAQIPYEIVNSFAKPLYFENLGTDKAAPQLTGSTIKILPKVTGGVEPYRYKFFIDEGNGLEVKQDFSSKNYYDFKPSKAGKHTICVEILDAKGNFTAAQIPYEIVNSFAKPLYFENLGTDKAAPQLTGSTIKILPKVTGGVEPYRYKFFIDEGNGLEVKQDFSSKNYYDFKPSKAGKHTICVEILDAKGNFTAAQIPYEIVNSFAKPLYFENLGTDKAAPQLTGSTIKVLPKVTGGVEPYRYKFFIDEGNGLEVKQDFSYKNYYDFKPSKAGKHTICVEILDAKGNFTAAQIPYEVVDSFVKPLYFENLGTDKAAPQPTGSTIKVLPKVTGGVEPYRYKFFIDEGNGLEVKQDFSYKNYYDFKPSKAGKHTICVEILDAKGNFTAAQIPYEIVANAVKPLYFEDLGTDKAAPQLTGSTIKVLPKVTGGVEPYRYKFFIDEGNGFEVKQDFSYKNYYDFKPSKAGKHTICVEILDAKGNFTAAQIPYEIVEGQSIVIGYVNSSTGINVRSGPGTNYGVLGALSNGARVEIVDSSNPSWYKIKYGSGFGYVHKDYIIASYKPLDFYVDRQMGTLNLTDKGGVWVPATRDEVRYYMDSNNFLGDDGIFMFMKLNNSNDIPASAVAGVVKGKGVLDGRENAFLAGAEKYNVNPLYLACHARLETGNGTSTLANGVLVRTVDNIPVEPKIVYNMFGIGALDGDHDYTVRTGSERAYKEGWFNPDTAITEGANWIGKNYINNQSYFQDTLYKMKWNLNYNGLIQHQYATDIGWAYKQAKMMAPILREYSNYLEFEIPIFE